MDDSLLATAMDGDSDDEQLIIGKKKQRKSNAWIEDEAEDDDDDDDFKGNNTCRTFFQQVKLQERNILHIETFWSLSLLMFKQNNLVWFFRHSQTKSSIGSSIGL